MRQQNILELFVVRFTEAQKRFWLNLIVSAQIWVERRLWVDCPAVFSSRANVFSLFISRTFKWGFFFSTLRLQNRALVLENLHGHLVLVFHLQLDLHFLSFFSKYSVWTLDLLKTLAPPLSPSWHLTLASQDPFEFNVASAFVPCEIKTNTNKLVLESDVFSFGLKEQVTSRKVMSGRLGEQTSSTPFGNVHQTAPLGGKTAIVTVWAAT